MKIDMILKFADEHVAKLKESSFLSNKKTAIAKHSFMIGFRVAMSLLENKDTEKK